MTLQENTPAGNPEPPIPEAGSIPVRSFVEDNYQEPTDPAKFKTRCLIGDSEVTIIGHSKNRAACIAISAAAQTMAAIGKQFECVEEVVLERGEHTEPLYRVYFIPGPASDRCIFGLVVSMAGIERTAPGSLEVHDGRKRKP